MLNIKTFSNPVTYDRFSNLILEIENTHLVRLKKNNTKKKPKRALQCAKSALCITTLSIKCKFSEFLGIHNKIFPPQVSTTCSNHMKKVARIGPEII